MPGWGEARAGARERRLVSPEGLACPAWTPTVPQATAAAVAQLQPGRGRRRPLLRGRRRRGPHPHHRSCRHRSHRRRRRGRQPVVGPLRLDGSGGSRRRTTARRGVDTNSAPPSVPVRSPSSRRGRCCVGVPPLSLPLPVPPSRPPVGPCDRSGREAIVLTRGLLSYIPPSPGPCVCGGPGSSPGGQPTARTPPPTFCGRAASRRRPRPRRVA